MANATLFKLSGIIDIKTNEVSTSLSKVESKTKETAKELKKLGTQAETTSNELKEMGTKAETTSEELKETGTQAEKAEVSTGILGGGLSSLSKRFISITAIIGTATKALTTFGKIQTEVAQLGTLFVGDTKAANDLSNAAQKMSRSLGIDTVQGLAAAYKVVSTQLGNTTEEYENATNAALKLARVGRGVGDSIDTTGVVNLLSTEIRSFNLDTGDTQKVADQLYKTIQLGNTDINQLASALPQVSEVASNVGVSFKELLAIIAGASKVMPDNIQITSSLTTALAQLQNSTSGVGKKFVQLYGTNFKDALAQTGSLTNLLVDFDNKLKASGSSLAEAFGVRGLKGISAIVGVADDINSSLAQIDNSSGLVEKGIQQLGDQGGLTFGQMKEEFENLLTTIGRIFAPILKAITPLISGISDALTPLSNVISETLTPVFETLGEVFGAIGEVITTITTALSPLISTFKSLFDTIEPLIKLAFMPLLDVIKALAPALNVLKPILSVIGYVLKGIGYVLKGIV